MLLFDESEHSANSQCAQDCAQDGDTVANTHPVKRQDYDCANNDCKIEDVPIVLKVGALLSDNFHYGFNCEYHHESVIADVDWGLVGFGLHVPVEGEDEGVCQDANHDEEIEVTVLGQANAPVTEACITAVRLQFPLRFGIHGHQHHSDPVVLSAAQGTIVTQKVFLSIECFNDDTNEELHEEHADEDDEDHRVEDHQWAVVSLGLVVWIHGVD